MANKEENVNSPIKTEHSQNDRNSSDIKSLGNHEQVFNGNHE